MESPFYSQNPITIMYLEPYLNTYYQSYQNIITFSGMPDGPISNLVTVLSTPKLSIFQNPGPFYSNPFNCTYVLLRYPKNQAPGNPSIKMVDYFMYADDIPAVINYLKKNGYIIDTQLNHIFSNTIIDNNERNLSGKRKYICSFFR
jgi:hypothetical protein